MTRTTNAAQDSAAEGDVLEAAGAPPASSAVEQVGEARPQKSPELSDEARATLAEIRERLEKTVGQLVLMLMNVPRYRYQTLADLTGLLIEPLLRDRIAIAHAKGPVGVDAEAAVPATPVGVAIWASVDQATDAKIQEQVKAGAMPIRLSGNEWASGEKVWLLDVIAPTREAASAVLANFGRIAGEREVQLHPIVASSVDPALLEKLKLS